MEAFFIFLIFVIIFIMFIILMNFKNTSTFNQRMIMKKLDKMNGDIEHIKSAYRIQKKVESGSPELTTFKEQKIEQVLQGVEQIVEEQKINEAEQKIKEPAIKEFDLKANQNTSAIYQQAKIKKSVQKTDFEKFIGENLLNKIGIIVLVLALIFFGKYAVDKGWLNETAKVFAIIMIGGILIGIAHRLRINYRAFSSVLAGGGIASLYIAIAIGFQLYELFSQTAAFLILIVITILAILLSLAYDKKELAVIAIFGGFATPILVSTGEGNYKVLFTYILILDIGMLVLAYFKKWNLVNFVANFATVILFLAWLSDIIIENKIIPHQGALIFATGFYLVFFLMNIINNIKENSKFTAFEFIMLLTNTFLYYWAGMVIMNDYNPDYMGLFTVLLALFNFAFAVPLYKRNQIDKNLVFLLIGLVLTFASIAVPVQFKGNYITMFWAAEMVLLLWLGQQSGIRLMKLASHLVSGLMIISLIMDWNQIYIYRSIDGETLPLFFNKGFITGFVSVMALIINMVLLKKVQDHLYHPALNSKLFSAINLVFFILILYLVLLFEIGYQVDTFYDNSDLTYIALACFNFVYLLSVYVWSSHKQIKFIVYALTALSVISLPIYIFVVSPHYKLMMGSYLIGESNSTFGMLHFLSALAVLIVCFYLWRNIKYVFKANQMLQRFTTWFSIIMGLIILSYELDFVVLHFNRPEYNDMHNLLRQNHLIGWPVLWGIIAFTLMFIGISKNERILRIIGISVFFFALIKLFAIDVWDMPAGGRIIAFTSLAVLLLFISFLYQKLKRIILEKEPEIENQQEINNA